MKWTLPNDNVINKGIFPDLYDTLIPDIYDNDEDDGNDDGQNNGIYKQSFVDIKGNVMEMLYGAKSDEKDKSPKGYIDVGIKPLCDLINYHPLYATLSSCSGRITLFNPNGENVEEVSSDGNSNNIDEATNTNANIGGKGKGVWLLSSHEEVDPLYVLQLLDENSQSQNQNSNFALFGGHQPFVFKHEPLLLHVASSSMQRGRQLLNIALQLGFRESGLVVSNKRITVAIRSTSLLLVVPILPSLLSSDYVRFIINEANKRMRINCDKLQQLQSTIRETLFRPKNLISMPFECNSKISGKNNILTAIFHKIPSLNLWNHASVCIPIANCDSDNSSSNNNTNDDVDVVVFGGYGSGPLANNIESSANSASSRSNKIYCLSRCGGLWDNCWVDIKPHQQENLSVLDYGGLKTIPIKEFESRIGHAGCLLPPIESPTSRDDAPAMILLWGGRTSPTSPIKDSLLFYKYYPHSREQQQTGGHRCRTGAFRKPVDVRGTLPTPRWSHTLTSLSTKARKENSSIHHLAVLIGGRASTITSIDDSQNDINHADDNEDKSSLKINSIHILSLVASSSSLSGSHLLWEEINTISSPLNRAVPKTAIFDHCTVKLNENGKNDHELLVFGGLSNPNNLTESFIMDSNTKGWGPIEGQKEKDYNFDEKEQGAECDSYGNVSIFCIDGSKQKMTIEETDVAIMNKNDKIDDDGLSILPKVFGAASCSLSIPQFPGAGDKNDGQEQMIVVSGGLPCNFTQETGEIDDAPMHCLVVVRCKSTEDEIAKKKIYLKHYDVIYETGPSLHDNTINFGSMVHHCAVPICNTPGEMLLFGGGVTSFAFGPTFAQSYRVEFRVGNPPSEKVYGSNRINTSINSHNEKKINSSPSNDIVANNNNDSSSEKKKLRVTNVIYVTNKNAKTLKTELENKSFLDKTYRMTKAKSVVTATPTSSLTYDPKIHIAVPITTSCLDYLLLCANSNNNDDLPQWHSLILGIGRQEVPFSTTVLGSRNLKKKR